MGRSHGSGQACYLARAETKCEDCRSYLRERQRRDANREGTYRYAQAHFQGRPGQVALDYSRRYMRARATRRDEKRLAEIVEVLNGEADRG